MAEHANADARPNPKAPTKATLVDAGLHLMLEKGYHHTGIQEVLQAAGVPKGSFYYYFPSKEAFGRAVIAQFAAAYVARLERWLGETTQSPLTRLHRHLDETLTHFERRGCRGGVSDWQSESRARGPKRALRRPAGSRVRRLAGALCAPVSGGPSGGRTAGGPRSAAACRVLSQ